MASEIVAPMQLAPKWGFYPDEAYTSFLPFERSTLKVWGNYFLFGFASLDLIGSFLTDFGMRHDSRQITTAHLSRSHSAYIVSRLFHLPFSRLR